MQKQVRVARRATFLLSGAAIVGLVGAASPMARAFSFVGTDRVNATTGVDLGFEVPTAARAYRWDNTGFTFPTGTADRSLVNGLTYNFEASMRTDISWSGGNVPTAVDFENAVTNAFNVWDAHPGLDFIKVNTTPVLTNRSAATDNVQGADIDIFSRASIGALGECAVYGIQNRNVTLTSGPANYSSSTIVASDIRITRNERSGGWTLLDFQRVLTHEIGHSLGLGDIEVRPFWDTDLVIDNAIAINMLDPLNTPGLINRGVLGNVFGGVTIMMETGAINNGVLANDDLGGLDFLYPRAVPEPASVAAIGLMCGAMMMRRRK